MSRKTEILLNKAIKFQNQTVYYFDSKGIYQKTSAKNAFAQKIYGVFEYNPGGVVGFKKWYEEDESLLKIDPYIFRRAAAQMKVGDKVNLFMKYVRELQKTEKLINSKTEKMEEKPSELTIADFITRIKQPIFKRETGNVNKKTFDFIYLDICIVHDWMVDKKQYINENIEEIKKLVVEHLEKSASFRKFGVPVNFLNITEITITRDDQIHFVFELKKI